MAEKKKYNSILVSGRKDETLTYSRFIKDEESGESVKESLDKKVNATDKLETQQIKDGAITNEKIKDKNVTNEKLADNSVSNEKIKDKSITNSKLGDDSVDGRNLCKSSVGNQHIDNNAVSTRQIAPGSVTNDKLAKNSVSSAELQSGLREYIRKKADAEQVNNSLYDLEKKIGERFVVDGDVTNLPDEEDLTSVKESERDILKLADRSYAPEKFSGKGYKILRRNIKPVSIAVTKIRVESVPSADGTLSFSINGKETQLAVSASTDNTTSLVAQKVASTLKESMTEYEVSTDASLITLTRKSGGSVTPSVFSTSTTGVVCTVTDSTKRESRNVITQIMINQPNTIYEIRYDFDLDGETIYVPENCVLKFEGGSIGNGTLITNKTTKITGLPRIFCYCKGLVFNNYIDITWLGAIGNPTYDSYESIQRALDWASSIEDYDDVMTVYIPSGKFGISKTLILKNNNKCTVHIKGQGEAPHVTSEIIAIAPMDWMITTNNRNDDNRTSFKNIILNGNRNGDYIIDEKFNENSTTMAKGGIKIYRYVYTRCENVEFKDINGIAIAVSLCWGVPFEKCWFNRCNYAIWFRSVTNGEVVRDCEFNQIRYVGIVAATTHGLFINNNIFEIIGGCAIAILTTGSQQASVCEIRNNYFEKTGFIGLSMKIVYNNVVLPKTHFAILITGNISSQTNFEDVFLLEKYYNTGSLIIEGNSFQQENIDKYNCLVFSNSLHNSKIINNTNTNNMNVLMSTGDIFTDKLSDIEISNNTINSTMKLLEHYNVYGEDIVTSNSSKEYAYNIFSNDSNKYQNGNLTRFIIPYVYNNSNTIKMKKEYFKFLPVFEITGKAIVILEPDSNFGDKNKLWETEGVKEALLYSSTDNWKTVVKRRWNSRNKSSINFTIGEDSKTTLFTLPIIRAVESSLSVENDFTIKAFSQDKFLQFIQSFIGRKGDKVYMPIMDDIDWYECVNDSKVGKNSWCKVINGVFYSLTDQHPDTNIIGFKYYNQTINKECMWNGTSWVNIDGSALS